LRRAAIARRAEAALFTGIRSAVTGWQPSCTPAQAMCNLSAPPKHFLTPEQE
jgi:hypothetical protein